MLQRDSGMTTTGQIMQLGGTTRKIIYQLKEGSSGSVAACF